jgi:hypothetical protein
MIKFFLLLALSSCATSKINYPLEAKKYQHDLVSVQTAVDLAMSSYLKACTDQKVKFERCKDLATDHVKNNIVFILDQSPEASFDKAHQP